MSYYIYVFLDPRKPGKFDYGEGLMFNYEPFYIGKGQGRRYKNHVSPKQLVAGINPNKEKILNDLISLGYNPTDYVVIYKQFDDEKLSLFEESKIIKLIGQLIINTGPLTNIGESYPDRKNVLKGKTYEEVFGIKIAKKLKENKRKRMLGKNNPNYGKPTWSTGKKLTKEHIERSALARSSPIYQIDRDTCEIVKEFQSIRLASQETGVSKQTINRVCSPSSKRYGAKSAGGYYWCYVKDYKNLKFQPYKREKSGPKRKSK